MWTVLTAASSSLQIYLNTRFTGRSEINGSLCIDQEVGKMVVLT